MASLPPVWRRNTAALHLPDLPERGIRQASSRSYGGFNLFASLRDLADLLENYGGHELAAGFTIARGKIDTFRTEISRRAQGLCRVRPGPPGIGGRLHDSAGAFDPAEHRRAAPARAPAAGAAPGLSSLWSRYSSSSSQRSAAASICGKKLRWGPRRIRPSAPSFSRPTHYRQRSSPEIPSTSPLPPQINEYRGVRSVQLNLVDIRPCQAERESTQVQREVYLRHRRCKPITADEAESLLPRRPDFTAVWRYLISPPGQGPGAGRFCVPVPQRSCATPAPPAP